MRNKLVAFAVIALLSFEVAAFGQQPGTSDYNRVYLPAHGLGDTTRAEPKRWGAFATGRKAAIGWHVGSSSESEAVEKALSDCAASGADNCRIEGVFFNRCAVFAQGRKHFATAADSPKVKSMEVLRAEALRECGDDTCTIRREGCALP